MADEVRSLVQRHWQLANERRWDEFAELLAPGLSYEVPQTREYAESGAGYLEMFRTWPGAWTARIVSLVCEAEQAVCVIEFVVGADVMTGISLFRFDGGTIVSVTDYWPEPYDPPPRLTPLLKRRGPAAPAGAGRGA